MQFVADCCQGNRAHYDLCLAREIQLTQMSGDFLVLHLPEMVKVAFMAATSDADPLRLEGLRTLEVIIEKFGETPEPEFPGHVILEQYQAQVQMIGEYFPPLLQCKYFKMISPPEVRYTRQDE